MADATPTRLTPAAELQAVDTFVHSPDFFHKLLEQLYEGVYFVDTQRRILYWNHAAHRISSYSSEEVIGHYCQDNILNHVDDNGTQLCFGKCPLVTCIDSGIPHECELYLHHKQGQRVPVRVRVTPVRNAEGRVIGAIEMFVETGSSKSRSEKLQHLHSRGFLDSLTELGNRRYLEIELFRALQDFRQHGLPFGAILLDIDHLRVLNEHYGHTIGDQALHVAAETFANAVDDSSILGRWSVDEFLVIVPNNSVEHVGDIAERCRTLVERSAIRLGPDQLAMTVSAGACVVDPLDTMEVFMRRLENLLQRSKYAGRNRVTLHR
jgi:diguanylate cyclase (GGDEF)-like protein/PAS domain S-box-containing protein